MITITIRKLSDGDPTTEVIVSEFDGVLRRVERGGEKGARAEEVN